MTRSPISLFIAASPVDQKFVDILTIHLSALENADELTTWHAGRLAAGENIAEAAREKLDRAKIIVLLISADLLADPELWNGALAREQARQCQLIPVLIRPTCLRATPLDGRLLLPHNGRPIIQYTDDELWRDIVDLVHKTINEMRGIRANVTPVPIINRRTNQRFKYIPFGIFLIIMMGLLIQITNKYTIKSNNVTWKINSQPDHVIVIQAADGKYLCTTPCLLTFPRQLVYLLIKLDSTKYWSKEVLLHLSEDGEINETLNQITNDSIPDPP